MTELDLGVADEPTSTEPVASVATTEPDVVETHSSESFAAKVSEADSILDALLGRISSVENKSKYLKILVYGNPGTGKTVFSATAPSPLIIDVEKGAHSINNHPALRGAKALEYKSLFQVEQLINFLAADAPQLAEYKTIIVDSFSELQKRDLDAIVKDEASKDANRNKFLPIGPDYNVNTEHMRVIASALRDLDRHIIVTCHVKEEKDETTGRILKRPNLTPKLAGTMAGIFDVVGYLATNGSGDNTTRTLQVHPTADVTAKTRIGNLPAVIENPTFDAIYTAFTTHNN
jgi:phage nucleotide-binding protein